MEKCWVHFPMGIPFCAHRPYKMEGKCENAKLSRNQASAGARETLLVVQV